MEYVKITTMDHIAIMTWEIAVWLQISQIMNVVIASAPGVVWILWIRFSTLDKNACVDNSLEHRTTNETIDRFWKILYLIGLS